MKKTFYTLSILFQLLSTSLFAQVHQAWNTPYQTQNDTFEILVFKADQYGNTYAGGYEGKNMFLQKINSQGTIEWTINDNKMIDSIPNGAFWNIPLDYARVADLTFDSSGGLYVVITKSYSGPEYFGCVLQLSAQADSLRFFHVYSNSLSYWGANIKLVLPKITLVHESQVLVYTAIWDPGVGHHHTVFLFDSIGTLKKHQVLPGSHSGSVEIAVNDLIASDSFVYLLSTTQHSGNGHRIIVTKINDSLNFIWNALEAVTYSGNVSFINKAHGLCLDNGYIYVTGSIYDTSNAPNLSSAYCFKYNSLGVREKLLHYNRNTESIETVNAFIQRNSGFYLTARSDDSFSSKAILISLDPNLDTIWTREFGNDITGKVLVERTTCQDHLYLSYADNTVLGNELHLVKFNSSGDILFDTITLISSDPGYNEFTASKTGLALTYNSVLPVDTLSYSLWYEQGQVREPVSFTTSLVTARSIHLNWILGAGNADSMVIYRKSEGQGNFSPLTVISSSVTVYIDTFLNPNKSYAYSIRVRSGQNYSCDSLFLTAQTLLNTGIQDGMPSGSQIVLYPNPTHGTLVVKMPEDQPLESVEVFDTRGRLVLDQTGQTIHIDTMPCGVYLVRINKLSHHKIIKQ